MTSGEHEAIPGSDNPGFDCVVGAHMTIDVYDADPGAATAPRETFATNLVGGWCVWCGTGAYDPDRLTDDGQPIGYNPHYRVFIPARFSRDPAGVR